MIASRFREIRAHFGLTAYAISEKVNASKSMWGQYEGGYKVPGWEMLENIAKLGVNIHWLVTGEGAMLSDEGQELQRLQKLEAAHRDDGRVEGPNFNTLSLKLRNVLAAMVGQWLNMWQDVVGALEGATAGLSTEELEQRLPKYEGGRLNLELQRMQQNKLVSMSRGRYHLMRGVHKLECAAELRTLAAVQEIVNVHLPVICMKTGRSRSEFGTIYVKRGEAVDAAKRLWRAINVWRESCMNSTTEDRRGQVKLVISSIALEPS